MFPDSDRVAAVLREVAEEEILPRFRQLGEGEIREKGPGDLVTIADEASERQISRRLMELSPGSTVVGEEAVAADRQILNRLYEDEPVWIIDPVDGTSNFANGHPVFGVVVAYVVGAETLAGWIYDPFGRRMASVMKGEGAWIDGVRMKVAPAAPASQMTGALGSRYFERKVRDHLEQRALHLGGTYNLHCASHEYLRLNSGEAHFSVYRKIMPWDHAAGALMHAEAGGYHAKLDGHRYGPTELNGGLLLAPDRASWIELRDVLFGD